MPSHFFLTQVVIAFLLILPFVCAQQGGTVSTTIDNSDPNISYFPSICSTNVIADCLGQWWDTVPQQSNSSFPSVKTSLGPSVAHNNAQTSMQYTFYGTKLNVYGLRDTQGAILLLQVDDTLQLVNTSSGLGGSTQVYSKLASVANLDGATVHTLSMSWCANNNTDPSTGKPFAQSIAYFGHFDIENFRQANSNVVDPSSPDSAASSTPPPPTPSSGTATENSGATESKSTIAVALGATVGSACFLIALFVFYLVRFRRSNFSRIPPFFHHRRRSSGGVQVIISSESADKRDNIFDYDFKVQPYLSYPPSYTTKDRADGSTPRSSTTVTSDYDVDLERAEPIGKTSPTPPQTDQQKRPSWLPRPVKAKLRLHMRDSYRGTHPGPSSSSTRHRSSDIELSALPLTPFVVSTASIARTESPSIMDLLDISMANSTAASKVLRGGNGPSEAGPSSRASTSYKHDVRCSRLPSPTWSASTLDLGPDACRASNEKKSLSFLASPPSASYTYNGRGRPSFDCVSIQTRSVPPPYALHPQ